MSNWAKRTIKNGKVKIYGNTYKVSEHHLKYDGRLDGMRYWFGLYYEGLEIKPYIAMHDREGCPDDDPQIVDGSYPWQWWNREGYSMWGSPATEDHNDKCRCSLKKAE